MIWGDGGDGVNPYAGLLGWADRIVVSPDSVNLLSEACGTRLPVAVALEQQAQGRMVRFQQALRARGRLQGRWLDWGYPGPIEPLRETGRIAAQVREALGIPA
ncbi:Mitochondrial fission ELM1 [compost metagenome]